MKKFILIAICIATVLANVELGLTQDFYEQINAESKTWTAGHNQRWDEFTLQSIQTQFGTFLDVPFEFQLPEKNFDAILNLPANFDARDQWPGCESIKEVRDQSTCGSCWAFGAAEAMSDRLCIASDQKLQTRISTEDLLTCCGSSCGFGCNGGFPGGAWSFFKNSGLVTGNEYNNHSYCRAYSFASCEHHVEGSKPSCGASQPTPKCTKACHTEYAAEYEQDKIRSKDAFSVPNNIAKIQTEIFTNGPVEAAFTVYEDFLTYKTGVYQHTKGSQLGGHAVKILGWGIEDSTPYWLVANSWNEDWGNQGFFKIVRGSNHCGIEGQITAGTVVV